MDSASYTDTKRFYENSREGHIIAEAAIQEIQRFEGAGHISGTGGKMGRSRENGGIRTIGIGISTELINKGYINLRGKEVNSPEQLAILAQVYRDPRFETLRFIYTKGNIIVGHEGITSKLPAASVAFLNLPSRDDCKDENEFIKKVKSAKVKFFMNMCTRMEKLEADGYFLLHNHPSGISVNASPEDMDMTAMYQKALSGFRGHIIINSNQYCYIDKDLCPTVYPLSMGKDCLLEPSLPHPLLDESIDSSNKLAALAKTMQLDPKYSVVLYVNAKNKIRAIQEVPDGLFNHENDCVNFLRGRMTEFGSSRAFVVTQNKKVKEMASNMVSKGYLLDAIITGNDYTITSVRESGVCPSLSSELYWMGRNINKGSRVNEKDYNYTAQHKPSENMLKKRETHTHVMGI